MQRRFRVLSDSRRTAACDVTALLRSAWSHRRGRIRPLGGCANHGGACRLHGKQRRCGSAAPVSYASRLRCSTWNTGDRCLKIRGPHALRAHRQMNLCARAGELTADIPGCERFAPGSVRSREEGQLRSEPPRHVARTLRSPSLAAALIAFALKVTRGGAQTSQGASGFLFSRSHVQAIRRIYDSI